MNDTPITVTLTWERWQQVIGLLGEVLAPARLTVPLMTEIQQQCQKQLQGNGQLAPATEPMQHVPH